jgi:hypothetical protein
MLADRVLLGAQILLAFIENGVVEKRVDAATMPGLNCHNQIMLLQGPRHQKLGEWLI